jgi:hypothetical protein
MIRLVLSVLLSTAAAALAQAPAEIPAPKPTPEELAFARLPADIRHLLAGMSAAQAMQTVAQTHQHAIALGIPRPTPEQFRAALGALLSSPYSTYTSASAGASSFPPLSPLVAPPPPPFLR